MLISFKEERGSSINSQCQRHHTTTTDWCCNFWILQNFNKEEETESWKKDGNKSYKYDITYKGIFYVNHLLYCIVKLAKKGIRQLLVVLSLDYGNLCFLSWWWLFRRNQSFCRVWHNFMMTYIACLQCSRCRHITVCMYIQLFTTYFKFLKYIHAVICFKSFRWQKYLQILNTHPYIHFEIVKRIKIRAWILVSHKEEENWFLPPFFLEAEALVCVVVVVGW